MLLALRRGHAKGDGRPVGGVGKDQDIRDMTDIAHAIDGSCSGIKTGYAEA